MGRRLRRRVVPGLLGVVVVGLALFTRGGTTMPSSYVMTGSSMAPTIGAGGWFVAGAQRGPLRRGQLVVVDLWIDDSLYHVLRRAVALAGDTARMAGGQLWINGRAALWPAQIVEPRAARTLDGPIHGTLYDWGPVVVGAESVFVLSDTRDMIGWPDSRFLGALPADRIRERHVVTLRRGAVDRRW